MSNKERLIEKFEHVKREYVKAFKSKLYDVCRKLGTELFELVDQLRALGMKHTDLGLSADFEYIIRSFEMVAKNPTSSHADDYIIDISELNPPRTFIAMLEKVKTKIFS